MGRSVGSMCYTGLVEHLMNFRMASTWTRLNRAFFVGAISAVFAGCGGGGQYGYAPEYAPLSSEDSHMEAVTEVSYEDIRRDPADYASVTVGWFGVVTAVLEGGAVEMTYRTLAARNLCRDERDSSCRVTVSERAGGPFTARLQMRPEDLDGENRLWIGSLVKAYGSPQGDFDENGGPIIQADYYRHWPRGTYVTTGSRGNMRR